MYGGFRNDTRNINSAHFIYWQFRLILTHLIRFVQRKQTKLGEILLAKCQHNIIQSEHLSLSTFAILVWFRHFMEGSKQNKVHSKYLYEHENKTKQMRRKLQRLTTDIVLDRVFHLLWVWFYDELKKKEAVRGKNTKLADSFYPKFAYVEFDPKQAPTIFHSIELHTKCAKSKYKCVTKPLGISYMYL